LKKIYIPAAALVTGFGLAFLAAGVSSYFFVLLPIAAFALGFFSTWRWGLLCGFLLYAGYTFALSLIWYGIDSPNLFYPIHYFSAFLGGGFCLLLIGALASKVRKGIRGFASVAVIVITVVTVGWCGYSAIPRYSYYYQVSLSTSENLNNLELFLPLGAVSGEPYEKLYSQVYRMPGYLTEDFTHNIVDTEQGYMLRITIPTLKKNNVPQPRYTANIIFRQSKAPDKLLQLLPKSAVTQVNTVISQRMTGPIKSHESLAVERFVIPLKIQADKPAQVNLTLLNRTDRSEDVNFTSSRREYPYTEQFRYDVQTGDDWHLLTVEATSVMNITGITD
jgi:hypothetical protein